MSLDRLRADWTTLGAEDPLWAIYVTPHARHGGWRVDDFLATGEDEIARVLDDVARLGVVVREGGVALDFGTGAGRLAQALARRFAVVVGVDISVPMLDVARRLDRSGGRCRFVHNDRPDLRFQPDRSVDLVYSSLVLQHMPRRLARTYVHEFLRVVRSDGVVIVQVATRPTRSVKGLLFRTLPTPVLRFAQRAILRYPAPMHMHAMPRRWMARVVTEAGGRILAAIDDQTYGGHWTYTRYVVVPQVSRGAASESPPPRR